MKATKKKPKKKKGTKSHSPLWQDDFYVKVYTLARQGATDSRIAKVLGITPGTFLAWKEKRPALKKALQQARSEKAKNFQASFREYVFKRLAPELQEVWDEINECEDEDSGVARIEALLSSRGKRARQHLFLYALVDANFNQSEACRKINISRATLDGWIKNDPGFSEIIDEMHWHKGNLFEEGLVKLVADGDSKATIFANRTFNRDRGYNEKIDVEHAGKVDHVHSLVDVDSLDLPLEMKSAILQAMRKKREQLEERESFPQLPAPEEDYEDAEIVSEVY